MPYVPPVKFLEMRKYAKEWIPHWVVPLDLTFCSMLRVFETGLVREKRRKRVVPQKIYAIDDSSSVIEFRGKFGVSRSVEVPYEKEAISRWYTEEAKKYKKESYRHWLKTKWDACTHDGRETAIINFLILHGSNVDVRLEILARTGHTGLNELMPYVRRYVTMKKTVDDEGLKIIKDMMNHMNITAKEKPTI